MYTYYVLVVKMEDGKDGSRQEYRTIEEARESGDAIREDLGFGYQIEQHQFDPVAMVDGRSILLDLKSKGSNR